MRDVFETNRLDRVHDDVPFVHRVTSADLDVRPHPDANAALDPSASNAFAKALREHHDPRSPFEGPAEAGHYLRYRLLATTRSRGASRRMTSTTSKPEASSNERNSSSDRSLASAVTRGNEVPLFALPDDDELAVEVAELLLAHGADPLVKNAAGLTPAQAAKKRGLEGAAAAISTAEE